ncbi:MAG: carbohydrate-binding domain-containing protein, partial [Bifidobacteriaceae bacterium]|nr:carbohydrate-binding domain-containing protein [Bifidobacteriaceae bacterium]
MIRRAALLAAALALVAAGCSATPSGQADGAPTGGGRTVAGGQADVPADVDSALTDKLDSHWQADDAVLGAVRTIELGGGSVEIDAPGAYRLTGTLSDGQVKVAVETKGLVQLVLDGAHVTSSTSAAINVAQADEVVIVLADGSVNTLTDAETYAEPDTEPDAALFSKADLSIAGGGALTVRGRAGDAIASKDGLVIAGGQLTVEAADDGVKGRDYLRVAGGEVTVAAGGDGLKSTNADDAGAGYVLLEGGAVTIEADSDCVDAATDALVTATTAFLACGDDAIHGDARLVMDGGEVEVKRSFEGLEAPVLVLAGGRLNVVASDDGLNAAASTSSGEDGEPAAPGRPGGGGRGGGRMGVQDGVTLVITGGVVTIEAGSDGIDSNGPGAIAGGTVTVYAPANGMNGPFDIAEGGPVVTGGVVTAYGTSGGRGAIISPDAGSTQAWLAAAFEAAGGGALTLADAAGRQIAVLEPNQAVSAVVFSSPDLADGDQYSLTADGVSLTVTAGQ